MKRLLFCLATLAGIGYAVWSYRQAMNESNAAAWAAGTDTL